MADLTVTHVQYSNGVTKEWWTFRTFIVTM